ncbi:MAG: DUF2723 domain-containing protein [Phycisphaerae bacterium]|nr:DUF2723 domain-containing protein [Phycisphaerae bacterium]
MTPSRFTPLYLYGWVFLCAALLYGVSCAPGLLWQDSGLIQYRVLNQDVAGSLGLAVSHPLHILAAMGTKILPWGPVATKVNLLSSVAGAVAVANVLLLVRLWTGRPAAALVAALTLALSHTFWQHASMAETYTLWTALFTAELIVLLQYTRTGRRGLLYGLGLLNGLAVAVHVLGVIPLAVYAVYFGLLCRRGLVRPRDLGLFALAWVAGCLPYEVLILQRLVETGDLRGTLCSALFGSRWQDEVLNTVITARMVKENLLLWLLNFPTPNGILAVLGSALLARRARSEPFGVVVLALTVLTLAFAFRYTVPDRYAFFIPFYVMVSLLAGWGAHIVLGRKGHVRWAAGAMVLAALVPVAVYAAAPWVARKAGVQIPTRGDVPYRDDLSFFLRPWKTGYTGADRFAAEALGSAAPHAVLYADLTTIGPLLVTQQTRGIRPDVAIVNPVVLHPASPPWNAQVLPGLLETRPVYVASCRSGNCPQFVRADYDLVEAGLLWQVRARGSGRAD